MEEIYTIIEVANTLQYAAVDPLSIGLGIISIINGIGQKRKAKKAYEEAEEDAAIAKEAYLSYAEKFDNPMQPGSTRSISKALDKDPSLMLGGNSPFSQLPAFTEFPFQDENDLAGGSTTETPAGNTAETAATMLSNNEIMQAMQQADIFGPNSLLNDLDPVKIQASLDMFNILGNGKLDVPPWELQAGFDKIAEETNYKSTNPDSEYFDEEAEFTGTQTEDVERDAEGNVVLDFDNLFTEEFKKQINTDEFKEAIKTSMEEAKKPFIDDEGNFDNAAFVEDMETKGRAAIEDGALASVTTEDGYLLNPDGTKSNVYIGVGGTAGIAGSTGGTGAGGFTIPGQSGTGTGTGTPGGSTPGFAGSIKALQMEELGGQLYVDSEIKNPYGRFRDKSGIIQDRSDIFTGANDRRRLLRDRSDMVDPTTGYLNDLRRGAEDFSGLAADTSDLASNTFANLQVATQAADLQAQQTDQALANTLSTIRATGAGAGGATAIAQAALQSKLGISATIEQQEARNTQLRAQGQQQVEQIRMSESKRLQDIAFSERLRLESLREREGLRLDTAAQTEAQRLQGIRFGEARRVDDTSFQEAGRIQQAQLSEAIRKQNIQLAEQQSLRQADVAGVQYQQGMAFDMAQRNLDRLSGLATQSMVNQQAAQAAQAATSGAVTGGLFQLAGGLFGGAFGGGSGSGGGGGGSTPGNTGAYSDFSRFLTG